MVHKTACIQPSLVLVMVLLSVNAVAATLTFHDQAYVKGPGVAVSDLADIQGEDVDLLGQIQVGMAPLPQNTKQFDVALVLARIKNAGIDTSQLEISGPRATRVTTLHQEITKDMITNALRCFVEGEMPWPAEEAEIDISTSLDDLVVPDGELSFEWKPSPEYRYLGIGSFRGTLMVDGKPQRTLVCKTTIEAYSNVILATREIPRGTPIVLSDLEMGKRPLSTLRGQLVEDPTQITQCIASKNIAAGQVLTKDVLALRQIIKKRQLVSVEATTGGLSISGQARADSDGAEGDIIPCTNLTSGQAFLGLVRRDGVVVVQ